MATKHSRILESGCANLFQGKGGQPRLQAVQVPLPVRPRGAGTRSGQPLGPGSFPRTRFTSQALPLTNKSNSLYSTKRVPRSGGWRGGLGLALYGMATLICRVHGRSHTSSHMYLAAGDEHASVYLETVPAWLKRLLGETEEAGLCNLCLFQCFDSPFSVWHLWEGGEGC